MLNNIDFTNYVSDTTLYVIDGAKEATDSLKNTLDELLCWFFKQSSESQS